MTAATTGAAVPSAHTTGEFGDLSDAISVNGVSQVFDLDRRRKFQALSNVSFQIRAGEFCTLIGPSGCGKSTLLRLMAGLIQPTDGEITVGSSNPSTARTNRKFGFVFQDAVLLPWRSALENVELPMSVAGIGKKQRRQRAKDLLELVGLADFHDSRPAQLSGGMARRVAIARALSLNPRIILLDEPFGALDEITRQRMNVELQRIWSAEQCTAVLVTHNVGEAVFLSDRVLVMAARPGRVVAERVIDLPRPRTLEMLADQRFFRHTTDLSAMLLADPGGPDAGG